MPVRWGAEVGWSLGVCLAGAMASGDAAARGAAPEPPSPAQPDVPVQTPQSTTPGEVPEGPFLDLVAQADAKRDAGAQAEAAALYGQAYRALPEDQRGSDTGEAVVRNAMAAHDLASAEALDLERLEAQAALLEAFLEDRRRARAAAQIAHAVPVPEVPQDLVQVLDDLYVRIDELVAAAEAAAAEPAPATVAPPVVVARPKLAPRPRHRIIYSNLSALRYNPLGLVNEFSIGYRYQLVDKDTTLFNESFIAAQLHTYVTPAFGRIGPKIDIQPLALLNLSATYDYTGYFGTFDLNQSFQSPTDDWSDSELQRRGESNDPARRNYPNRGHFVTLSALLQAKVGKIAIRDNLRFYWSDYELRAGDTVSYDQTLDITIPDRAWAMTNDLDVLYLANKRLTLGARYTVTEAFYLPRHFQDAEPVSRPNGPTHRVGPAVLYTFFNRPHQRFNKPTLIVLVQWWAAHRFRTGVDVSAAIPYFVLGFRFEGDIWPDPATWNRKRVPKRKRKAQSR